MAAPDPAAVERAGLLAQLGIAEDLTLSLADLRMMTGHSADAARAREAYEAKTAEDAGPVDDPSAIKEEDLYDMYYRSPSYAGALANCAPKTFIKTYRVQSGATTSAALGIYGTINDAITQCNNDIKAQFSNVNADLIRSNPYLYRRILVAAGNYNELVTLPNHVALVGETGRREDVRIYNAGDAGTGAVLITTGVSCYVADLVLDFTGTDEHWHPWRDGGPSGSVDTTAGRQRRTLIFDNVSFYTSNILASMGSAPVDCTFGPGCDAWMINCEFRQDNGVQVINFPMNTSLPASGAVPSRIVIINPKIRMNYDQRQPMTGGSPNGPAGPIGLIDMGAGNGDTFYLQGGEYDIGNGLSVDGVTRPGVSGLVTAGRQTFNGIIESGRWFIDPLLPLGNEVEGITWPAVFNQGVTDATRIQRSMRLPQPPLNGVSPAEDLAYRIHPNDLPLVDYNRSRLFANIATAKAALVANRKYYVRVPIERAFIIGQAVIGATAQKGVNVAFGIFADNNGVPSTDANMRQTFSPIVGLMATDRMVVARNTTRRPWYPYAKYVWLCFACDSATPTWDTATDQTNFPVKYEDGWGGAQFGAPGALTDLTAGQAFPVVIAKHLTLDQTSVFTAVATHTYTIPKEARAIQIIAIGGGGGGGSGRRGAAGTIRTGGAGGNGGARIDMMIPTDILGDTITAQISAGGTGGAAIGADDTNGAAGTGGGFVLIRSNGVEICRAGGGGGGGGGSAAAATAAGATTGYYGTAGVGGASSTTAAGVAAATTAAFIGAPGGGGGGNITAANAQFGGGNGGIAQGLGPAAGTAGGAAGANNGANGVDIVSNNSVGYGGGGGGGNSAGAGGNGGNGGNYGAGGGGGGASTNGSNSGAGGNGGSPVCIIIPIF